MSDPFEAAGFRRAGSGPAPAPQGAAGIDPRQPLAAQVDAATRPGGRPLDAAFGSAPSNDPFEAAGFKRSDQVGTGDAVGAIQEGFTGGLLRGAGGLAGAGLGIKAGAPFGPVGMAVGGLTGAALGAAGPGEWAASGVGARKPEDMPPQQRPFGYFGESLGGSATVVGSIYSLAQTGVRAMDKGVGLVFNQIMDFAKRRPVPFVLTEGASAVTAAGGAGIAEAIAPGQEGARYTAEIIGGMFGPRISEAIVKRGYEEIRKLYEGFTPGGAEAGAVRMIQEVFERTGGDVSATAEIYRKAGLLEQLGVTATPAQKTGSPELAALEEFVATLDKDFARTVDKRFADALDVLRVQVATLSSTGRPEDLAMAAKIQSDFFSGLATARSENAIQQATQMASKISTDDPGKMAELSTKMNEIVQGAIRTSRVEEKRLWNAWLSVDGDRPAKPTNLERVYRQYQEELGTFGPSFLPKEIDQFIKSLEGPAGQQLSFDPTTGLMSMTPTRGQVKPTTAKELWNYKSTLGSLADTASTGADPNWKKARILNDLSEAAAQDMESALSASGQTAYDAARSFTKNFYDTYQRSFVGQTQATGAFGNRMAPELIARRALTGPAEAANVKLDELDEVTKFLTRYGLGGETAVADMLDAQERIFRITAAEVIDPGTGRVVPEKIDKLLKSKKALFDRFPEVRNDLLAAKTSEAQARKLTEITAGQLQSFDNKAFGRILRKDPIPAAREVLASPNMERDLRQFLNVAANVRRTKSGGFVVDPEMAKRGAVDAVMQAAMQQSFARTPDGQRVLLPEAFRASLTTRAAPGQKTPLEIMREMNMIDDAQLKNINRLFTTLDSLKASQRFEQGAVQVTADVSDAAGAVIARMLGSGAAGSLARSAGSSTPSLIVHGAGAKFFEHVYKKLGITTASRFLSEAMLDPVKMDALLAKASTMTPVQRAQANQRIHAWLVQAGMGQLEESGEGIMDQFQFNQPAEPTPMFSQPR